jgi:hypothetical protein
LELHCRQKAPDVQPNRWRNQVVADQQQDDYSQVNNNIKDEFRNKLWVICGSAEPRRNLSHIVGSSSFDMPLIAAEMAGFYRKL